MALTLDATLATAQDAASRHPLAEITSYPTVADIPFDGRAFTGSSVNEFQPFVFNHSTGVTILIYITTPGLVFAYTDAAGNQFTTVALAGETGCTGVSACELANGNIGIVYLEGAYSLKYRIVTPTGAAVGSGTIDNWSTTSQSHTWVVYDSANAQYYMVYAKKVGTDYNIYKRTSANFTTWSAESVITPAGLTVTQRISSPSLLKLADGAWWLYFDHVTYISPDGVEVANLYYAVSADQGATWGAAVALTSNSDISQTYKHPVAMQKTATDMWLAYTKEQALLLMSLYTEVCLDFDAATDKLYVTSRALDIKEIDVSTWEVTRTWNSGTTPALSNGIINNSRMVEYPFTGSARYHLLGDHQLLSVLDSVTNTVRNYNFRDFPTYSILHNMTYSANTILDEGKIAGGIIAAYVDESASRLYVAFSFLQIGWIDLTAAGPTYLFTTIIQDDNTPPLDWRDAVDVFQVNADDDLVFFGGLGWGDAGVLSVWNLSSAALYKRYHWDSYAYFPRSGPNRAFLYEGGFCYLGFSYQALYGEVDKRGLAKVNLVTDEVQYYRPTYSNIDDYAFRRITKGKDNTLIVTSDYGVATFDTVDLSWDLYDQALIPQIPSDNFTHVVYDPSREFIFAISGGSNVAGLPLVGTLKSAQYMTGAYSGGAWTFTDHGAMVSGFSDYDAMLAVSPVTATVMMAFWEEKLPSGQLTLKWDTDSPSYDLTPLLTNDRDITIERDITGTPNRLTFACADGHLFDPHNSSSLLSGVLKKGRKLVARWGETVAGVDYWQDAGTFYVVENQVAYEKGVYTDISVTAEDMRCLWQRKHVYATDFYNESYPETVLADIVKKNTGLLDGDITLPTFANRIILEHQWLDLDLLDIVEQICERFGYFPRVTVDDKLSVGQISSAAAVAHVYSNSTKLIRFEPDDSYSDFTNRVTVQGQSKDYITVVYAEERVGDLNGTVGWWGYNKNFDVYYSPDKSRTCVNPRLKVIETATSIAFALAGKISERISYEDPDEHYCTVNVDAPDLTAWLIVATAMYLNTLRIPDTVTVGGAGTYPTWRVGTLASGMTSIVVLSILSAIGNYQYEIWAQPTGRVRRSVQAAANDLLHQGDIGTVIERKIEDPLCYSPADCSVVANFELMVVSLQRNRIKLTKIAHLQDEEGDIIQIRHPYSGAVLSVLIVSLARSYRKASTPDGDGYFIDAIEGWVI